MSYSSLTLCLLLSNKLFPFHIIFFHWCIGSCTRGEGGLEWDVVIDRRCNQELDFRSSHECEGLKFKQSISQTFSCDNLIFQPLAFFWETKTCFPEQKRTWNSLPYFRYCTIFSDKPHCVEEKIWFKLKQHTTLDCWVKVTVTLSTTITSLSHIRRL